MFSWISSHESRPIDVECKEPAEGGGLFEGWGRWVTPNIGGYAESFSSPFEGFLA